MSAATTGGVGGAVLADLADAQADLVALRGRVSQAESWRQELVRRAHAEGHRNEVIAGALGVSRAMAHRIRTGRR